MKKFLLGAAILVASIGTASASPAITNLVQNGSFESNTMNNGSWGFVNLTGWTSSGDVGNALGKTELRNNVAGKAFDGNNFVELDGNQNSSITQALNTAVNQMYTLSFAYANRIGTQAATNGIQWSFGGSSGNAPVVNDFGVWHTFSTNVLASSTQTNLKFTAIGTSDSYGSSLDKISVSPVPEPEEWAMMMLGLGLIGAKLSRKNKNEDSFTVQNLA